MEHDLKPCPFCGSEAIFFSYVDFDMRANNTRPACQVKCTKCKAYMGDFISTDNTFSYKDTAKNEWNRRVDNG